VLRWLFHLELRSDKVVAFLASFRFARSFVDARSGVSFCHRNVELVNAGAAEISA